MNTEVELLRKAREGDPVAAEEFFTTYIKDSKPLAGLLRRTLRNPEDRSEMLHDIYLQLMAGSHSFRGDAKLSTYVYQVARIAVFQKFRRENTLKRGKAHRIILDANEMADETMANQEFTYGMKQARKILTDAINSLPAAYRETLLLRIFEDLSYGEIAQKLNLPLNTVSTRIHKGKKILAVIFRNKGSREVFDF